jgi:hypothetical protein
MVGKLLADGQTFCKAVLGIENQPSVLGIDPPLPAASVVADAPEDCAEVFPAASYADTA